MSAEAPPDSRRAPERRTPPAGWRLLVTPGAVGLHLVAVAVIGVCLIAGLWQYQAFENERAAERADRTGAAPVPLADLTSPDEPLRGDLVGRPVQATGTYAPTEQQLLVSGRQHEGRDGWWVLSPLLVEDDTALLVVRGWTDEPTLPPVPAGPVTVTAWLQPGEDAGAVSTPTADSRVVDSVRLPSLVNALPYRLHPAYAVRSAEQPAPADGLVPVAPVPPDPSWTTGAKNFAYAWQWWVFGAFALFMWWRILSDRMHPRDRPAPPTP